LICALAILVSSGTANAATIETANFVVEAPSPELAKKFGELAEFYRREKALEWLGHEMPNWPSKCPVKVIVNGAGAGGATTFGFGSDGTRSFVTSQQMEIHGEVKQLMHSVLPHEITHTVLAQHFGQPVPRWADEGGSVLSENDEERFQHDVRCRELLNAGRGIRLGVLFRMANYPRDLLVLYAQGYSITAYLVEKGGGGREGRGRLLQYLAMGMQNSTRDSHGTPETWDNAARQVYGFENVNAMEKAWLDYLRNPNPRVAARTNGNTPAMPTAFSNDAKMDIRTSAPLPLLDPPVKSVRGTAPDIEPIRPITTATKPTAPDYPPPSVLLPPEIPRRN
jgi:hypothetical protein